MRGSSGLTTCASSELRAELIEQHRGGHAADRVLGGLVEEAAAVERAVHVGVEQNEQFLVEIVSGLAFHRQSSQNNGAYGRAQGNTCR